MPFINDRFYANPIFGRALERARLAEAGKVWSEEYPEGAQQGIKEGGGQGQAGRHLSERHRTAHTRNSKDGYDAATTPAGVANQIYNETAGLRPTSKNGTGSGTDWDMQQARRSIAHVIHNRAAVEMRGGLASDQLAPREIRAIEKIGSPAYNAHGASLDAAHAAAIYPDSTGGAMYFYLEHGQGSPGWAAGKKLIGEYGPFRDSAGKGPLKDASTRVRVYH